MDRGGGLMEETGGQLPSTADAFIQMAYDLFDAGQEASEHELAFLEAPMARCAWS